MILRIIRASGGRTSQISTRTVLVLVRVRYNNLVDFSFIVSLYVSDLFNVTTVRYNRIPAGTVIRPCNYLTCLPTVGKIRLGKTVYLTGPYLRYSRPWCVLYSTVRQGMIPCVW